MIDIDFKKVTNIVFTCKEDERKFRFVLDRRWFYKADRKMREAGCEPILVVDRKDVSVWWLDDYAFLAECLGLGGEDADYNWVLACTECKAWWPYEGGMVYRTKDGRTIRAHISIVPMNETTGSCTNDCEFVDL